MTSLQKCFLPPVPPTVQQTNVSHILVLKNPKHIEKIKNIYSFSMHCISKKTVHQQKLPNKINSVMEGLTCKILP